MNITGRVNITSQKSSNYLIMGWWSNTTAYKLSDVGIPVVKVADGTAAGFSVYALNIESSTVGASPAGSGASQWRLIESTAFMYMLEAYIERLRFESAIGGGFELGDGLFKSIKKDANGNPYIIIDGTNGKIYGQNVDVEGEIKAKTGYFEGLVRMPFKSYVDSISWWLGQDGDWPIVTGSSSTNIRMYPLFPSNLVNLPPTNINGYRITILNECTDEANSLNYYGRVLISAGTNRIFNSNYPTSPTTSSVVQSMYIERGEIIELLGIEGMPTRPPINLDKGWFILDRKRVLPITS